MSTPRQSPSSPPSDVETKFNGPPVHVFDASNSVGRPLHRGGGGPVQNDVVSYLKTHAYRFNTVFVDKLIEADVVFTNDVWPSEVLLTSKPRVKRMDGVFWASDLVERNAPYNEAACQADHVIFISNFSRRSFFELYGHALKDFSVCTNSVDPDIFWRKHGFNPQPSRWVSVATDWSRPEKRFEDTMRFASMVDELVLVGACASSTPSNVVTLGYLDDPDVVADVLRACDAMVCLSYRDPCPKVVAQAVSCGLPVLYSSTGGVSEMSPAGVPVVEDMSISFADGTPHANDEQVSDALTRFVGQWPVLARSAVSCVDTDFEDMLGHYFAVFRHVSSL